jgi:hypothetical protein
MHMQERHFNISYKTLQSVEETQHLASLNKSKQFISANMIIYELKEINPTVDRQYLPFLDCKR